MIDRSGQFVKYHWITSFFAMTSTFSPPPTPSKGGQRASIPLWRGQGEVSILSFSDCLKICNERFAMTGRVTSFRPKWRNLLIIKSYLPYKFLRFLSTTLKTGSRNDDSVASIKKLIIV
jgi:hypothetical protein